MKNPDLINPNTKVDLSKDEILNDYNIAYQSRQASLIGRKEVLAGKAKFGIFGDGKEIAQVAMARAFQKGDWRSGYYRDQTFMLAIGETDIAAFFSQLYADTNIEHEPASGGRQMGSHFASRFLDNQGNWQNQKDKYNIAADLSPTAGQMAKLVGLGYASKLYRQQSKLKEWDQYQKFSAEGNEVAFGTIGNASTSEGVFWEAINAAGVLQIPLAISIWDDEYGISVPAKYHTVKTSISKALEGFRSNEKELGIDLYVFKGWDYPSLVKGYKEGISKCRELHTPAVFHIIEMTQPQGHSTSGSHERYKSTERLKYENSIDCIATMRQWIVNSGIATDNELDSLEQSAIKYVEDQKELAWQRFRAPILKEREEAITLLQTIEQEDPQNSAIASARKKLQDLPSFTRRNICSTLERILLALRDNSSPGKNQLCSYLQEYQKINRERYNTHLINENEHSPLSVIEIKPKYGEKLKIVDSRNIIQSYFDLKFSQDPRVFVIGEDVGKIGGVNAEFEGLQEKHGELQLTDTGIREATILGQGIGAAMRGLRPIIEIQYLDYLLYCFQTLSDDLASLHYRSAGGQASPCIIRTRGHRLEGIWHSGSPISMILGGARGIHVCVPRNSTQAAGMYETLLQGNDPALVIEVLNGYRTKEPMAENIGSYTVPLGVPEIIHEGNDITVVTYGANVRIAQEAIQVLNDYDIGVELIDVQTLLPFDRFNIIKKSIEKTNAVIFFDEDVPGGATAYMMREVIERQNAYDYLDAAPRCLSAQAHRPAYASDGDYFSKPNAEDLISLIYEVMHEREPKSFPEYK
ncbi:MAG: thiamine pyrophosphate-dependent enzyme [Bdellovibrionota bacterium]